MSRTALALALAIGLVSFVGTTAHAETPAVGSTGAIAVCDRLETLRKKAREAAAQNRLESALSIYAEAAAAVDAPGSSLCRGVNDPGLVRLRYAMALSNRGRFLEAENQFGSAEKRGSEDTRFACYQSLYLRYHRFNQGKVEQGEEGVPQPESCRSGDAEGMREALVGLGGDDGDEATAQSVLAFMEYATDAHRSMSMAKPSCDAAGRLLDQAAKKLDDARAAAADFGRRDLPGLPEVLAIRRAQLDMCYGRDATVSARAALELAAERDGNGKLAANARKILADALAEKGNVAEAFEEYRKAFERLGSFPDPRTPDFFNVFWEKTIPEARSGPLTATAQERLFEATQLVRTADVSRFIAASTVRFLEGGSDEAQTVSRYQSALQEFREAKRTYDLVQDGALVADPRQALAHVERKRKDVERLEAEVGALPSYVRVTDRPASLQQVRSLMRPDEVFIQVVTGRSGSVILVFDQQNFWVKRSRDLDEETAKPLVKAIEAGLTRGYRDQSTLTAFLSFLYEELFKIEGFSIGRYRLASSSVSGPLASVPLAVLISEPPTGDAERRIASKDFSQVAFLGNQWAISRFVSPRSYVELRNNPARGAWSRKFTGFGSFEASIPDRATRLGGASSCQAYLQSALTPLPASGEEVEEVARLVGAAPGDTFLGKGFNDAALLEREFEPTSILYFAAHGTSPMEAVAEKYGCSGLQAMRQSTIVTSLGAEKSGSGGVGSGDGFLVEDEIARLRSRGGQLADLVVLSNCVSGLGGADETQREALGGLARAFFQAGARRMIVAVATVPDKEAKDLMIETFRSLKDGTVSVSEALALAQRKMSKNPETSNPRLWGQFIVVGDGTRPLELVQETTG